MGLSHCILIIIRRQVIIVDAAPAVNVGAAGKGVAAHAVDLFVGSEFGILRSGALGEGELLIHAPDVEGVNPVSLGPGEGARRGSCRFYVCKACLKNYSLSGFLRSGFLCTTGKENGNCQETDIS